jgi:hypothetical protein
MAKQGNTALAAPRTKENMRAFVIALTILPLAAFASTILLFAWGYFYHKHMVLSIVILTLLFALSQTQSRTRAADENPYKVPLGILMLFAVTFGSVCGIYVYDVYSHFTYLYRNSRTYQDALPSAPAASYADAGRFSFAREAYVDQEKSVGFAAPDGHTYCVAPIRDLANKAIVEFWAVGYDCCEPTGDFYCDAAKDAAARGGIVVFDNPGFFGASNKDNYSHARAKAEATFQIQSTEYPLYVRWVYTSDINKVENFYVNRTWMWTGLVTALSVLPVWMLAKGFQKVFFDDDTTPAS